MFCNKCGSQLPENTKFCPACGAPQAWVQSEPARPQQQYEQPRYDQPTYSTSASSTSDYTRMGGWLLFFMILCIIDAVVGLISSIGSQAEYSQYADMIAYAGYGWMNGVMILTTIVTIVASVVELYFVYLVFKRNPNFLRVFQILKIAMIVILIVLIGVMSASGLGSASNWGSVVGSILGLVVMTLYYVKSVRVRTYMGGTEYIKRALFPKA